MIFSPGVSLLNISSIISSFERRSRALCKAIFVVNAFGMNAFGNRASPRCPARLTSSSVKLLISRPILRARVESTKSGLSRCSMQTGNSNPSLSSRASTSCLSWRVSVHLVLVIQKSIHYVILHARPIAFYITSLGLEKEPANHVNLSRSHPSGA